MLRKTLLFCLLATFFLVLITGCGDGKDDSDDVPSFETSNEDSLGNTDSETDDDEEDDVKCPKFSYATYFEDDLSEVEITSSSATVSNLQSNKVAYKSGDIMRLSFTFEDNEMDVTTALVSFDAFKTGYYVFDISSQTFGNFSGNIMLSDTIAENEEGIYTISMMLQDQNGNYSNKLETELAFE